MSLVEQCRGFLVSLLLRVLLVHLIRLGALQCVVDHADQVVRDVAGTGRLRRGHRRIAPPLCREGSRRASVWSRDPLLVSNWAHARDEPLCKFLATPAPAPSRRHGWVETSYALAHMSVPAA